MVMTWSLECFATGSVMESSGTRELVLMVLLNVLLAGNMSSAFFFHMLLAQRILCFAKKEDLWQRTPKKEAKKKKSPPFSFESSILTRCSKFRLSVKETLLRVRKHLPRTFRKIVRMPVELWHVSGSREFF